MSDIGYAKASMDRALKELKHANESYVPARRRSPPSPTSWTRSAPSSS
jgi:hypothetical protein